MANDLKYTAALRNTMLDAITTAADVGTAALLRIYDGTQPTDADTAIGAQVLLAELTMTATSFTAASAGVLTADTITADASANASGTASWFRLVTSAGATVLQGTVGLDSGTFDLELNSVTITAGDNVAVSSWTITGGNV